MFKFKKEMNLAPILLSSNRGDGHMGVSAPGNRKKFFEKNGISEKSVVDIIVAHGDKIKNADKKDGGKFFEGYDAIITNEKEISIALVVADCLPIAVFDPKGKAALIHAGWRGLKNGIIAKVLKHMGKNSTVYVGPHICQKHYEVKSEVSGKFKKYRGYIKKAGNKEYLDLGLIAKMQLIRAGIKEKNINMDPRCTFEEKDLFSYRRGNLKDRNLYLLTLNNS